MVRSVQKTVYNPDVHPVEVFMLRLSGHSYDKISKMLGITSRTLQDDWARKPAVAYALEQADRLRETPNAYSQFSDFAFQRLSPLMRSYWEHLVGDLTPEDRIDLEEQIRRSPLREQQSLFLHAWCTRAQFIASNACLMTGISMLEFKRWVRDDPQFGQLMQEAEICRKDFIEIPMLQLIAAGHPLAVVHANKTVNRDRGYGEKLEVNVTGTISQERTFRLEEIMEDLSAEVLQEILTAVRRRRLVEATDTIVDAELVSPEEVSLL